MVTDVQVGVGATGVETLCPFVTVREGPPQVIPLSPHGTGLGPVKRGPTFPTERVSHLTSSV